MTRVRNRLTEAERDAIISGVFIKDGKKYVSPKYIAEKFNLGDSYIVSWNIRSLNLDHIIINTRRFIKEEDIYFILTNSTNFLKSFTLENFDEKMQQMYLDRSWIKNKLQTFDLFLEYTSVKVSKSRTLDKVSLLKRYRQCIEHIFNKFDTEVFNLSDDTISSLLKDELISKESKKVFVGFIKYSRTKFDCAYTGTYNTTSKQPSHSNEKNIYTKQEVKSYYEFVKNTDTHIPNALNDIKYAEVWFYISMHFINGWRNKDILLFPKSKIAYLYHSVDIENIDINKAQSIINTINEVNNFFANKTGALNKFLVNRDMLIPLATSILILENHYKENSSEYLLNWSRNLARLEPKNIDQIIKIKANGLPNFSTKKANDSFLTYLFYSASKGVKNADIANVLVTRARSHKSLDTLKHYVSTSNKDGLLDDVSYNLFRRGHFGWLFYSLLDIVIEGDKKHLSVDDKTEIIERYQKQYTPQSMEKISEFFLNKQNSYKSITLEIANMDNIDLNKIFHSILKGQMPCRADVGQCIYSKNCKKTNSNCNTCPYVIPKIYILNSLKSDIKKVIDQLRICKDYHTADRIRNTTILYKYLELLNQAVVDLGKDYVQSFIDLGNLKQQLNSINNKLLKKV